ncbi:MAG: UPF0280 family protein, partial [Candidatus Omnitrophica bacterium]|nr:UPF0280 family protein [Candidatus Omnitrophota bacterium]
MKTHKYQKRFYRDWVKAKDLHKTHIVVKETDLQILTDRCVDEGFVRSRVEKYRLDIENYITKDRRFLTSLKPIPVELNAKPIVKEMARAAEKADVGPMAAVAGAVAQFVGKDLLKKGYNEVIIENGGDIFLKMRKARTIGIYCGKDKPWNNLRLRIKPKETPLGI